MDDNYIPLGMKAENLGLLCWFFFLVPIWLYLLINISYAGYEQFLNNFVSVDFLSLIVMLLAIYIAHESLHILGALISGIKPGALDFIFDKTTISIECVCKDQMSIFGYQVFLLLPFLILTPLLVACAYVSDSHLAWQVLVLSISGCTFDLTTALGLIGIPGKTRIIPELKGQDGYVYLRAAI